MATIEEQITGYVTTLLEGMMVSNGYYYNMGSHVFYWRPREVPFNSADLPAIAFRDAHDEMQTKAFGKIEHILHVEFEMAAEIAADGLPVATQVKRLISDLYKALQNGGNETYGGFVTYVKPVSREIDIHQEEKLIGGALVMIDFYYTAPKWQI